MYSNELLECEYSAIKVQDSPQIICENEVEDPDDPDDEVGVATAVAVTVGCHSSSSSR